MQNAIPYKRWVLPSSTSSATGTTNSGGQSAEPSTTNVKQLVAENPVVVIGRRGCCMCLVVKQLLLGLGVNPPVVDVDDHEEAAVIKELSGIVGRHSAGKDGQVLQFPAVFVRGKLFGGLERVMATHITGELVPILKQAGALWL